MLDMDTLSFQEKCTNLLAIEKAIKGLGDKARDIASAKRDLETQEEALRESIVEEMSSDGVSLAEECGLIFSLQNAPARPLVTDDEKIPDEYFKVSRTLDKTKLNADIKEGKSIPGTTLSNGGYTLVIRAKGRSK